MISDSDGTGVFWYRITETFVSAGCDDYGDPLPWAGGVTYTLRALEVISETPKGVWVQDSHRPFGSDGRRWIKKDANKRYACPTIEEAVESFEARKLRQIKILQAQARRAQVALDKSKTINFNLETPYYDKFYIPY